MIDLMDELLFTLKKCNTSYKLFLLKYLVLNISDEKSDFDFDELCKGMLAESWEYIETKASKFTKNDKLLALAREVCESSQGELSFYSSKTEVERYLKKDNGEVIRMIRPLCRYAPYRLDINEQLDEFLRNKLDSEKNGIIQEMSHKYDLFYEIWDKRITINRNYLLFIKNNRNKILDVINGEVERRYLK